MELRIARTGDEAAVAALYVEQFKNSAQLMPDYSQEGTQSLAFIEETIAADDADFLILEDAGEVIGFAQIQSRSTPEHFNFVVPHRYAYLMDIILSEACRGKGSGKLLMEYAIDWAKARGLDYIELDVFSNNPRAISLYKKCGFINRRHNMVKSL